MNDIIKVGDIVSRNKYNNDMYFKVDNKKDILLIITQSIKSLI